MRPVVALVAEGGQKGGEAGDGRQQKSQNDEDARHSGAAPLRQQVPLCLEQDEAGGRGQRGHHCTPKAILKLNTFLHFFLHFFYTFFTLFFTLF